MILNIQIIFIIILLSLSGCSDNRTEYEKCLDTPYSSLIDPLLNKKGGFKSYDDCHHLLKEGY